jgi:hypothetical protein
MTFGALRASARYDLKDRSGDRRGAMHRILLWPPRTVTNTRGPTSRDTSSAVSKAARSALICVKTRRALYQRHQHGMCRNHDRTFRRSKQELETCSDGLHGDFQRSA